jgi:hypothetical protein
LVFEFSEPIQRIDGFFYDRAFVGPQWNENRTLLTMPLDATILEPLAWAELRFGALVDDAGNRFSMEKSFRVDKQPPEIVALHVIDRENLLIIFNEDVQLTEQTRILLNQHVETLPAARHSSDKSLQVKVAGLDLTTAESQILSISELRDIHGNFAKQRSSRFSFSTDKTAPRITSIKQTASRYKDYTQYLGFEIEYSEYVLDRRDMNVGVSDELGLLLFDSFLSIKVNGVELSLWHAEWIPRSDHKGGTLYWSMYSGGKEFLNDQTNTMAMQLIDIAGNREWSEFSLKVDTQGPLIKGKSTQIDRCEMMGTNGFRCPLEGTDVVSAVIQPETVFAKDSYSWKVSDDWIEFTFQQTLSESSLSNIILEDEVGNSSPLIGMNQVIFRPVTAPPQIREITAFSDRILELRFSRPVGAIEQVLVDDKPRKFTLRNVEESRGDFDFYQYVVICFEEPIEAGEHDIELRGVSRQRNPAAKSSSLKRSALTNTATSLLVSSLAEAHELFRGMNLRVELSQPLAGHSWKMFARTGDISIALSDLTRIEEPMTPYGTWPVLFHKPSAIGLTPDAAQQTLILEIDGKPSVPMQVAWSTMEPQFYLFNDHANEKAFGVVTTVDMDLDSLQIEVSSGDDKIQVSREWLEPFTSLNGLNGFQVKLPEGMSFRKGKQRVRITAARTKIFRMELSKPFEASFLLD